ncbi:MAG: outer membrane beta-barrel protein [Bacteroidales bacterium]
MLKKNYFLIATCIALLLSSSVLAQNRYKKGFIVTNGNDTLHGLINIKLESGSSNQCQFIGENQEHQNFYAFQIKSTMMNDEYFVSKEVELGNEKKNMFLKVLYKSYVTLYKLDRTNYFIAKGDSLYLLNTIEKEVVNKGIQYSITLNKYQGILSYLFNDEPTMKLMIKHTRLTDASLVKVSKQYSSLKCNDCTSNNYTKNKKYSIYIEPQVGLIHSILNFKTSDDHATSLSPTFGINLHVSSNYYPRFEFLVNPTYSKFHFKGDFTHTIYRDKQTSRVDLNYSTISIPIMARFLLSKRKLQPSITLGLNNTFLFQEDCKLSKVILDVAGNEIYVIPESTDMRKHQIGIIIGLGLNYKINSKSSIHFNCDFEYRRTSVNTHYFLDKQQLYILQPRIGYSYMIK